MLKDFLNIWTEITSGLRNTENSFSSDLLSESQLQHDLESFLGSFRFQDCIFVQAAAVGILMLHDGFSFLISGYKKSKLLKVTEENLKWV